MFVLAYEFSSFVFLLYIYNYNDMLLPFFLNKCSFLLPFDSLISIALLAELRIF